MDVLLPAVLAAALLGITLQDAFEVMLLPRRVQRQLRLVGLFFRSTWSIWSTLAVRLPNGSRREHFLSLYGPLSMVLLFVTWSMSLIGSFGVLEWALQTAADVHPPPTLSQQLYMSGVTFFTLGYGDVSPHTAASRFLAVVEAGTGLGLLAVVIGYLPVLYQFFSRREAHVIQLGRRAGSPPTAITLLRRHADGGGLEKLDDLLRQWEIWGSDLLESHLSYPMLVYYRSQHDDESWLAALAAIMDCCALILVGIEDLPPFQARMTFTMARQVLVEVNQSFHIGPARFSGGDRLPHAAYVGIERCFEEAGLSWKAGPAAEETLAALRATYEPLLKGLSSYLLLPLPGWVADPAAGDHWERGPRGLIARRLVKDLAERPDRRSAPDATVEPGARWRRLRRRLRPDG